MGKCVSQIHSALELRTLHVCWNGEQIYMVFLYNNEFNQVCSKDHQPSHNALMLT